MLPTSTVPLQCEVLGEPVPLSRIVTKVQEEVKNGSLQKRDISWIYFLREELQSKIKKFIINVRTSRISLQEATLHRNYILGLKTAIGDLDLSIEYYLKKNNLTKEQLLIFQPNSKEEWLAWLMEKKF